MSASLVETLSGLITPSLLGTISSSLGESEVATTKALGAAFPTVLAGLLSRSSDQAAMGTLEGLLRDKANDGSLLANLGSLVGTGVSSPVQQLGTRFMDGIFGHRIGALAGALAQFSGMRSASASSLLALAGPVVMSVLGSKLSETGGGLAGLLGSQRQAILGAVPQGLASVIGGLSTPPIPRAPVAAQDRRSGLAWLLPVAVALLLAAIGWTLMSRPAPEETALTSAPDTAPLVEATSAPAATTALWPDLGAFARRALPGNAGELNIPERGIESRLLAFIENPAAPADKETWFDFDRILFDTGAATLRSESDEQIANIVSILRAFPSVALKVGGYTDNTGQAAANMTLSQARADSVMRAVVVKGIDASRLEAEGYGDQHPVANNATEEGRQKNRRVSVRVTKK
jgi:OOP family OmpA-OmpF porin